MTADEALVVTKKLNEQLGPPIGWALALVTLAAEVNRLRTELEATEAKRAYQATLANQRLDRNLELAAELAEIAENGRKEIERLRARNAKLIETLQEHGLLRAAGCECHLEEGDSPCRVHGDEP